MARRDATRRDVRQVYDTTLDIKLTEGGTKWVDDFAVKGPSPRAAPYSWRGSPVANGAHYPLYGEVTPGQPGVLQARRCRRRGCVCAPRVSLFFCSFRGAPCRFIFFASRGAVASRGMCAASLFVRIFSRAVSLSRPRLPSRRRVLLGRRADARRV